MQYSRFLEPVGVSISQIAQDHSDHLLAPRKELLDPRSLTFGGQWVEAELRIPSLSPCSVGRETFGSGPGLPVPKILEKTPGPHAAAL